ncbi:uncharacterized protein MELLADRAFT_93855 [Melampsora larici-populina 98AG31]|uniref:Uncharacterized protein n=1 Tax=Melampsora larici-populina (strain 98AG31 / pathotype 3-4-7) TaxID=747676 RepID=F4S5H6_MELLP|nr:uncharacterized protein MELLADRAFT_93855 [Melampsora larici-populina 98AG31]EGG00028.1 hypothetical protein MELLADRAFT_93855 [Melampsora larici-populina 98AG31]
MSHNPDPESNVRKLRTRSSALRSQTHDQPHDQAQETSTVNSEQSAKKTSRKRKPSSSSVQDFLRGSEQLDRPKEPRSIKLRLGDKVNRDELLGLLDQQVTTKRTRLPNRTLPKRPKRETKKKIHNEATNSKQAGLKKFDTSSGVDADGFSRYRNEELVAMLRDVGLDMAGKDREILIQNCKYYEDLLLPPSALPNTHAIIAESTHNEIAVSPGYQFNLESTHDDIDSSPGYQFDFHVSKPKANPIIASTSTLPSIKRGTLRFPRPPPTQLFPQESSLNRKGKGKQKLVEESESDWIPENENGKDIETEDKNMDRSNSNELPNSPEPMDKSSENKTNKSKSTSAFQPTSILEEEVGEDSEVESVRFDKQSSNIDPQADLYLKLKRTVEQNTQNIIKLTDLLSKANVRIEDLTEELNTLADVLKRQVCDGTKNRSKDSKIRGGRTSARIRFHVETLFGQKLDVIPPPATSSEKEAWDYERDIGSIEIDPTFHSDDNEDGPGHPDASSQQLSIMRQMLKAAGISSFRPDLGQAPTSSENRWLWDIAFKIFLKLVEVGEYTGILLDADNRDYIKNL